MVNECATASKKDRFDLKGCKITMKAVVTNGNGGYEKLEYRDAPVQGRACIGHWSVGRCRIGRRATGEAPGDHGDGHCGKGEACKYVFTRTDCGRPARVY